MSTTTGNSREALEMGNIQLKPIGISSPQKNAGQCCDYCGREFNELEIKNTKLILEQERLLINIKKAKEGLAIAITELQKEKDGCERDE